MRILWALLLLATLPAVANRPPETGFLNRTITVGAASLPYQVYVPVDYRRRGPKRPVILFLHGAGERGTDGLFQTQEGLPAAIRKHMARWPALVVMPQCPLDANWNDPRLSGLALAALEATIKAFGGDRDRVYLTGLSMGGYGSWLLASQRPELFAAVVPVCGGAILSGRLRKPGATPDTTLYRKIAVGIGNRLPVWTFHGAKDPVVPVTETRRLVAELRAVGGNVQYTEYPEVDHFAWVPAYDDPALPEWLFRQRRGGKRQ